MGMAREEEGGQDGAVKLPGHDEHTATWAEKHRQVRQSVRPRFAHSVITYKSLSASSRPVSSFRERKCVTVRTFTPTPLLSAQAFQK